MEGDVLELRVAENAPDALVGVVDDVNLDEVLCEYILKHQSGATKAEGMLTKVHLSARLTFGEPGAPGQDARRSSFAMLSSRRSRRPEASSASLVGCAKTALRREKVNSAAVNLNILKFVGGGRRKWVQERMCGEKGARTTKAQGAGTGH